MHVERRSRQLGAVLAVGLATLLLGGFGTAARPGQPLTVHNQPRITAKKPTGGHGHGGGGGSSTFGWASSNWSGYAITGSNFTSVSSTWTVPTVIPSTGPTYSSTWTGIDGFNNSSLIQAGTEQDSVNGSAQYYAWWEILPAAETIIPSSQVTVEPGNSITVTISQNSPGGSQWTIELVDNTTGAGFTTTQTYTGPGASAEWIEEAPTVGGRVATLADYTEATFNPGSVNGGNNPSLVVNDGGVMVQKRQQVSTPSLPDHDTDGFNVAYGSTTPSAPST